MRLYLQPEKLAEKLPTLHLLTRSLDELQANAEQVKVRLEKRLNSAYFLQIETSSAQIGSGSQPMAQIPSVAVTIAETCGKLTALLARFKTLTTPIIARVEQNKIWLDMRSVADINALLKTLEEL